MKDSFLWAPGVGALTFQTVKNALIFPLRADYYKECAGRQRGRAVRTTSAGCATPAGAGLLELSEPFGNPPIETSAPEAVQALRRSRK